MWQIIDCQQRDPELSERDKLECVAFSILAMLDGINLGTDGPSRKDYGWLHNWFYEIQREQQRAVQITVRVEQ